MSPVHLLLTSLNIVFKLLLSVFCNRNGVFTLMNQNIMTSHRWRDIDHLL